MLEVGGGEAIEAMVINIIDEMEWYHVGLLLRYIIKWAIRNEMKGAFRQVIFFTWIQWWRS
jgi:hypothetical protein